MCGCTPAPLEEDPALDEFPPSVERVAETLAAEGPLTQKEIVERTDLASRTVRSAIADLREAGIVTEELYLLDLRQRKYTLADR